MRVILFYIFLVITMGVSCKSSQKGKSSPVIREKTAKVQQGIQGTVFELVGNQMPSPSNTGNKTNTGNPYPTTVFFYEPTNINQVIRVNQGPLYNIINTKLISTVKTDSTGAFIAALPIGTYSVFVQVDKLFFANNFDIRNNISLVSVEANKLTEIKIQVNNNATY
jgi:hypothetical protein